MDRRNLQFIVGVLNDPNGINETAWQHLMSLRGTDDALDVILDQVDGCDGRYFLPEDAPCIEEYN